MMTPDLEQRQGARGARWLQPGLLAALFMLLSACASSHRDWAAEPPPYPMMEGERGGAPMELAPGGAVEQDFASLPIASGSVSGPTSKLGKLVRIGSFGGSKTPSSREEPARASGGEPPSKRLVHYNGYAQLRVTRQETALDRIRELAEEAGGYVERLTNASITVRIPVAVFKELFDKVLELGEVLDKSLNAQDVTDAYQAIDLRMRTAETSRQRLLALLEKAKTEKEKLALLKEIQRVTQEIDELKAKIRTLKGLAAYSRLSVDLLQRESLTTRSVEEDIAEFKWIRALSPFKRYSLKKKWRLEFDVPEDMVLLTQTKRWIVESADGTVFWTRKRENIPEGDSSFWIEAIRSRLKEDFASVELEDIGAFNVLRFVERSDDPYRYLIGVHADGEVLELIEVYYPNETQERRYDASVRAAIEKGVK